MTRRAAFWLKRTIAFVALATLLALSFLGGHQWAYFAAMPVWLGILVDNGARYRQRHGSGPLPDGRLMRWWTKLPGPSKNPEDYR